MTDFERNLTKHNSLGIIKNLQALIVSINQTLRKRLLHEIRKAWKFPFETFAIYPQKNVKVYLLLQFV